MPEPKEIQFELLIAKSQEKTYFEVPFTVPDKVAKLEVFYSYERKRVETDDSGGIYQQEINIIDIAIRDESFSFRGASGSERLNFYLSENHATPGYLRGKINSGEWALVLGAYKVQDEGCPLQITIKFTQKTRMLLKGDLHVHSTHSDGKYTVVDIIKMAKLQGLDFLCLTDHNTFSQNEEIIATDFLTVIPGMEWTHYNGHANFLGVKRPIRHFVANNKETTINIMDEARQNGALIVLCHPFCKFCPWKWGFNLPYQVVEIWNGPIKESEYEAVLWWNSQLVAGRILPIVGGSDAHKNELFRILSTPTTFLYSDSRGESDLIAAIESGHAFISYAPDGPRIDLAIAGAIMGDSICFSKNLTGTVKVQSIKSGDRIKLLSDRGNETVFVVDGQTEKTITFQVEKRLFYRVEVWRELIPTLPALISLSNPVYIR